MIGESAGAMILSPDITYVKTMDDLKPAPNLEAYTGLGVTHFSTLPHYLDAPFVNETSDIFKSYHETINFIPINNQETITILNDELMKL